MDIADSGIDFIGYETSVTLDRICMPSSTVLSNALSDVLDSLTTEIRSGEFASMSEDISNVITFFIVELAMDSMWSRNGCGHLTDLHVLVEMPCRMHCVVLLHWLYFIICRSGSPVLV